LNPPGGLKLAELKTKRDAGTVLQTSVGNSRADWRTVALDRATDIEKFDSIAAEAVALFEGRGASKESVEDARSYVRKLRGGRAGGAAKPATDAGGNPVLDETEKGISAAQTSAAAKISTMYELIDSKRSPNTPRSTSPASPPPSFAPSSTPPKQNTTPRSPRSQSFPTPAASATNFSISTPIAFASSRASSKPSSAAPTASKAPNTRQLMRYRLESRNCKSKPKVLDFRKNPW